MKLEDIRIASPCPASWNEMYGDEKSRFCNICSKNVYNISAMTRPEAQLFINKMDGGFCGLLYMRKDGTVLTADCPVGLSALRKLIAKRIAMVAAIVVSLFTGGATMVRDSGVTGKTMGAIMPRPTPAQQQTTPQVPQETKEQLRSIGYIDE